MHAIIKTGGKQYRVTEGDKLRVETLAANPGDAIEFPEVLLVSADGATTVGTPLVSGARRNLRFAAPATHSRGRLLRLEFLGISACTRPKRRHIHSRGSNASCRAAQSASHDAASQAVGPDTGPVRR